MPINFRFDFGVPLEDVFPPNDIHPRLKYAFKKAFEVYVKSDDNIEHILRYGQGSLNERLTLKHKLTFSLEYQLNIEGFSSGAYFWVIRHFLGLLPLPVLPSYTKGIYFAWDMVAEECKLLFTCHDREKRNVLDYDIAQAVNMLPLENVILLNVLIHFLRKISTNEIGRLRKFRRTSLTALKNYFCPSLFIRPFRPGYSKKNEYGPLLLYLIIRWQNITQHCRSVGHPTYFLNSDLNDLNNNGIFNASGACTQTNKFRNAFFDPEIITICKNIPFVNDICKKYFIDNACQTETDLCKENKKSYSQVHSTGDENDLLNETNKNCNRSIYKLAYIEESDRDPDAYDDTIYQTAPEITFKSTLEEDNNQDWSKVVKETLETVKKVEESYIYDDYETFKMEDFNQIGKNREDSFISKISKSGLVQNISKRLPMKELKSSTPKKNSPESENSYVKYPDVSEHSQDVYEDNDKNREFEEINITDQHIKDDVRDSKGFMGQKLFQSNSPTSVQGEDSTQNLQNDNVKNKKKKRAYILNRIRMSLDILKTITPKKSTFKKIESKVRYRRITNEKFRTI